MNRRSRSTLFLMEQLIVVAVFAICAAACVRILSASYFMATETKEMNNAIRVAESSAESYKATEGDLQKTAEVLGGSTVSINGSTAAVVFYDKDWHVCSESDAQYMLRMVKEPTADAPATLHSGVLSIEKLTGELILTFPVSATTR